MENSVDSCLNATPSTNTTKLGTEKATVVRRKLEMKAPDKPVQKTTKDTQNVRKCGGMKLRARGRVRVYDSDENTEAENGETVQITGKEKAIAKTNSQTHNCTECKRKFKDEKKLQNHFKRSHKKAAVVMTSSAPENGPVEVTAPDHEAKTTNDEPSTSQAVQSKESECSGSREKGLDAESEEDDEDTSKDDDEDISKMSTTIHQLIQTKKGQKGSKNQPNTEANEKETAIATYYNLRFRMPGRIGNERVFPMVGEVNPPTHLCILCEIQFPNKRAIMNHFECHEGLRPFPCPVCLWACETEIQLLEHWTKHSNEPAFKCGGCGRAYKTQRGITSHQILKKCSTPRASASKVTISQ